MRLLHVSLRSLLIYSLVLVLLSIPVVLFSIQHILDEELDESLALNSKQFIDHIKAFEYLDDLETDLQVLDQLSYNIRIKSSTSINEPSYETVLVYDSLAHEENPFRQLSSGIVIKGKPYLLTVRTSKVDNNDLVIAIGTVQMVLIVLLTTGLLIINRTLSKKLWIPFYDTINRLKAFELDRNKSFETDKTRILEFDDLNDAIRNLTERNRQIFLQQKEFIENASHELQTPLAIFQSKLDVLMQQPSLSESFAQTIAELESTAQRMGRLNRNLLLLSKIDNEQFITKENLELEKIIFDLLDKIRPIAAMNGITVDLHVTSMQLYANRSLTEVLLTNLFHNAVRHTPANQMISVSLTNHTLEISNPGEPLRNPTVMFNRFTKESGNPNSTGLGLAIVKKIIDTSGYTLTYSYSNGRHVFSVNFGTSRTNRD